VGSAPPYVSLATKSASRRVRCAPAVCDLEGARERSGAVLRGVAATIFTQPLHHSGLILTPSFRHDEVFPLIARLVFESARHAEEYVRHRDLVAAILSDDEGRHRILEARQLKEWSDDESVATSMVSWFSKRFTDRSTGWVEAFDRNSVDGRWAYRPKDEFRAALGEENEHSALEGTLLLLVHKRIERDPHLVAAKRAEVRAAFGREVCEACGFSTGDVYPGLPGEVCEVHHLRPLSEVNGPVRTRKQDLAILCANCHRAIHRTKPLTSVPAFRSRFFGSPSE
jgi:hypothetical protein